MRSQRADMDDACRQAEEVGPKVAHSIRRFFDEPRNRELVERLREAGLTFTHEKKARHVGPLEGQDFVLDRHAADAGAAKKPRKRSRRRAER